jgi:predicted RNA-binding Zn ribbon-like protein
MIRTDWASLEFTRTTGWEERDRPGDDLDAYEGLLDWAEAQGVVEAETARELRREAEARPDAASRVLEEARRLRSALYEMFTSVAREDDPPGEALEVLNASLREAGARLRLSGGGRSYGWSFDPSARGSLEWPLWRVARSAAELLTSDEEVGRLELCDARDCGWLFVDASRNRSRRWCDMAGCGNRAKARRYRERHES